MAKPERHDVDYFPFFAKRGRTLNILQSKYGLEGIGFFTNIMRFLALTPDHYYCIKEEYDRLNFFAEIGLQDEIRGIEMIELMVKTEKFDRQLWEDHRVIASGAFLDSLSEAYRKRNNNIITLDEIRQIFNKGGRNPDNSGSIPEKEDKTDDNGGCNPQSKVKQSKEEESKVKQSKEGAIAPNDCENSDPKTLFLHFWQHAPNVFNALARIESPKEWDNFWEKSKTTREQVETAMRNYLADVECGAIERRFIPSTPDRFVLKGWITKCQERLIAKNAGPPRGTSPPVYAGTSGAKKSL